MHKQFKNGNFVHKLQKILSLPTYSHIIAWDSSERYIDILDSHLMQTEITPLFFRHSKFESFVRQLNLYGFRKVKNHGGLRFTHPLLLDGAPLSHIASSKNPKTEKKLSDRILEPSQQNLAQNAERDDIIPAISLAIAEQKRSKTLKKEENVSSPVERKMEEQQLANSSCMMMQNNYWNMWNMMSMMQMGSYWPPLMSTNPPQSQFSG